jgi:hypothetical protein
MCCQSSVEPTDMPVKSLADMDKDNEDQKRAIQQPSILRGRSWYLKGCSLQRLFFTFFAFAIAATAKYMKDADWFRCRRRLEAKMRPRKQQQQQQQS